MRVLDDRLDLRDGGSKGLDQFGNWEQSWRLRVASCPFGVMNAFVVRRAFNGFYVFWEAWIFFACSFRLGIHLLPPRRYFRGPAFARQ